MPLPNRYLWTPSQNLTHLEDNQRTRVLHILDSFSMGGVETWVMELLRLWHRPGSRGPKLDFLLTRGKRGIFDDEARDLGAQLYYVPYSRATLIDFVVQFRRIVKQGKYDAIHDHADYVSGWRFLMSAPQPPVRIAHVHNAWMHIEENYATTFSRRITTLVGKRLVVLLATHICGTSERTLRDFGFRLNHTRHPLVSVLHCGFDVKTFNAPREQDRASVLREFFWPEDSRIVLFAGRLDRGLEFNDPRNQKNSWLALNILRTAFEKESRIRFVMAGAGPSRQELESRVESWGLKDKFRLIGIRTDISRLMRAADVLLFPSRQEGLGMVAVEAQAAGLPVLASTAIPKECIVIPDAFSALSLDESIERWAGALLQIMSKPRPALELCRRALESSDFSIVNSARRLEEIYRGTRQ